MREDLSLPAVVTSLPRCGYPVSVCHRKKGSNDLIRKKMPRMKGGRSGGIFFPVYFGYLGGESLFHKMIRSVRLWLHSLGLQSGSNPTQLCDLGKVSWLL